MQSPQFPDREPGDPETVILALETGQREWERADFAQAVRWIRRAADAAEAAGNDGRALELARRAADILSALDGSAPPTPRDEAAALATQDDFSDQTIVEPPEAVLALQPLRDPDRIEAEAPSTQSGARAGSAGLVRLRTTLRVSVGFTATSDGDLKVSVLPEGHKPPPGTTEALLVLLDPDARAPATVT